MNFQGRKLLPLCEGRIIRNCGLRSCPVGDLARPKATRPVEPDECSGRIRPADLVLRNSVAAFVPRLAGGESLSVPMSTKSSRAASSHDVILDCVRAKAERRVYLRLVLNVQAGGGDVRLQALSVGALRLTRPVRESRSLCACCAESETHSCLLCTLGRYCNGRGRARARARAHAHARRRSPRSPERAETLHWRFRLLRLGHRM